MSTLNASAISRVELVVPQYGAWRADVVLENGEPPSGAAVLTVGDLVLHGTVLRAAFDAPGKPHAVVVGGAGWERTVARPLSFQSDAGVRLSTVLAALAKGAGETIEQPNDTTVGNYWECVASRPSDPVRYRDALAELARAGVLPPWRSDPDGVTRFGSRTGVEVTTRATEIRSNAGVGSKTYGVDIVAPFLPGASVDGAAIARLLVVETTGKLEVEVWTSEPTAAPTVRDSILRIVRCLLSEFTRTYVVARVGSDKRLDLIPPPDAPHLPEMAAVEQWTLGGALVTPAVGAEVVVVFRDVGKTRPVAVAFGPGTPTAIDVDGTTVNIGAAATAGIHLLAGSVNLPIGAEVGQVVRYGDMVQLAVSGILAVGPLLQQATSAPNSIAKVRAA